MCILLANVDSLMVTTVFNNNFNIKLESQLYIQIMYD